MPLPHPLAIIGMLCGFALTPASVWADCQPVAGTTDAITVARAKAASNNAAEHVDLPRVGERFTVTIPQPDTEVADVTVCFDNIEVKPELHDKNKPPLPAVYWIVVPSVANVSSGMVPFGDHALHVRWSYVLKDNSKQPAEDRYEFLLKPVLARVEVNAVSERNQKTQVLLFGDGFDKNNKSKYLILLNDQPRDVCWPNVNGCSSPPALKGDIEGPHTIVLENVNLEEQIPSQFQVCYGDQSDPHCSKVVPDNSDWSNHVKVLSLSIGVPVVIGAGIVLLVLLSRSLLVLWGERYVLSVLLLDKETDTFSLSKLQFYVWTAAAVFGYSYLTFSRFLVQHWHELPAVPSGLPGIVGIAAGTAVGAQVVTKVNGPKGAGKLHPSLSDLITTGDVVAAERVQFLIWTIIGAVGFSTAVAYLDPRLIVNLPDVPPSILAISGISAFGYLGGKLARDAGPVINEAIVTVGPDPDVVAPGSQPASSAAPTPGNVLAVKGPAKVAVAELATAGNIGTIGQDAAKAVQDILTAVPLSPTVDSSTQFGLLELRGRMLSRDATFKISLKPDSAADDFQLVFDRLQPSPKDNQHIQKPRVVEGDPEAGRDTTLAKRLLLVVTLTDQTRDFFRAGSTHTLTVTNPDSQRVVFRYDVPATQKAS